MPYFLLLYDVVENYVDARTPFRPQHLEMAQAERVAGRLILAGAFGDPPHGAAFVFHTEDAGPIEDFARRDPYVLNGVVTRWRVEPWNVVIGADSYASP
ncbi:MAG: hypothetical protein JO165_05315 [Candidatus Eremiobacteraeota bacterium]|nr:hypothetical protein [Candidatus Eremiobacteraeota bacterium]